MKLGSMFVAAVAALVLGAGAAHAQPAQQIRLNTAVNGTLASGDTTLPSGEFSDSYTFNGQAGQVLDVRLSSTAFDSYVFIRGPNNFSEDNDDDPAGGHNSRLTVTLPANGQYTIVATSYQSGESGAYQIRVGLGSATQQQQATNPQQQQPQQVQSANAAIGQTYNGTLANGDQRLQSGEFQDGYSFQGQAGQRVVVDMRSTAFDTYLILRAPSGAQEDNDDAGSTQQSRIETVLAETGVYRVTATSFQPGETGAYQLSINPLGDTRTVAQVPAGAGQGTLSPGRAVSGALASGDTQLSSGEFVDNWTFAGRAGQSVTVSMTSSAVDSYLILRAPSGAQEDNDDATPDTRNSTVTWTLPENGTYSVGATTYQPGETGAYQINFRVGGSPTNPPRPTGRGRVFAVMVGISDYGGIANNLPHTADDARQLASTLQSEGVLAGQSVTLIDAQATRAGVRAAFQRVAQLAGPDDLFLFFYSGHGSQNRGQVSETEPDGMDESIVLRDGQVSDDEMKEWFSSVRSRALIVLDSCFSGGFARDVVSRPGVMGLFSSEEDLTSAVADKFQAGGYLSYFIRTGFGGDADLDHNGSITAGELSVYLRQQFQQQEAIQSTTREGQRNYQFLVVERGGTKIDDVVLALR